MWKFEHKICINILIVIIDVHLLFVDSSTPAEASLKVRDTGVVDKVYAECFNFRTLVLSGDNETILAGCRNKLLQLNYDLNVTKSLDFNVCKAPEFDITCEQEKGDEIDYYCHNYIRTIVELTDDRNGKYFVCGTNALRPLCYYVTQDFERDAKNPLGDNCIVDGENITAGLYNGKELGAFNPDQNISSILISTDSGERKLYTATSVNSAETQPMIRRSNMSNLNDQTKVIIDGYEKWLKKPQFVGKPIEFKGRIYFFFREHAQEFDNAGSTVFSRVAAVCKNDTGGGASSSLAGMWTTYIKARLNCSLKGDYPFYYNHLQDIYQSPSMSNIIYAVFTTQEYGQAGSALCTYNMNEIELLIEEGDLKGQESPNSLWLPYSQTGHDPIDPRPGSCSPVQPVTNYDDIRSYSLIDSPVPNLADYREPDDPPSLTRVSSDPLLIQKDVRFLQLVVQENVNNSQFDMFYIGTDRGTLIKFLKPVDGGEGFLSQEINLDVMERVLTMELWNEWIFIGSENAIQRVPLNHCAAYKTPFQKCLTKDPYCHFSDPQDVCEEVALTDVVGPENVTADEGDVVYLFCHAIIEEGFALNLEWSKDGIILTDGVAFESFQHLLQGEITYDYQYGKKIEHEVRSHLRVFVNSKTAGIYTCRIHGNDFEFIHKGEVKKKEVMVTEGSYELRAAEQTRLQKLSDDTKEQFDSINDQCVISNDELCDDVTGMDIAKGFTDSNPYIGMNKIPTT